MSTPILGADLVGESAPFRAVVEKVRRILERGPAQRRLPPILIQGETGTGKGVIARAIWRAGSRASARFVEVNCAAIPETLLEAELFGFERGAFTGARESKPGLFHEAHRGTLFLDEVGLLPEAQQAKLLTVVEEGAVRRLGRTKSEAVDVSILSASSADLHAAVREHRFREDLYHRLAVVTLSLPPLRERGSDILLLADRFLARNAVSYSLPPKTFSADARAALLAYPWPGNVRELANVVERVALLAEELVVTPEILALPAATALRTRPAEADNGERPAAGGIRSSSGAPGRGDGVPAELGEDELDEALRRSGGNVSRAAGLLGITRNTMRYRLEKRRGHPVTPRERRGVAVEGRSPAQTPAPASPGTLHDSPLPRFRWERRHLALLLVRARGDAASFPAEAARLFEAVDEKVESFGGRIVEIGRPRGEILATFGLDGLEDASTGAALAAMAIRKVCEESLAGERKTGAVEAEVAAAPPGLGLHVAPIEVARGPRFAWMDRDERAAASDLLAGLVESEPAGSIVVSAESRRLLARKFVLEPGRRNGVWHLLRRKEVSDPQTAAATRFVGRQKPLAQLRDLLDRADSGEGQVVGITGEPGIGKSRLFSEFRRAVRERKINYIGAHCESHTAGIPFFSVVKLIQASCGLTEADSPEITSEKISRNLAGLGIDPVEASPYLLKLLGVRQGDAVAERLSALSSKEIDAHTFDVMWRMIWNKNARPQPLVIGVEDAHWIDRASERYYRGLAERISSARVLLLLTSRSGYGHPVPNGAGRVPWTEIPLEPLTADESREVMEEILPPESVPEPLADTILARAGGNPFFIEELSLFVGRPEARSEAAAVPETIQAALESRFDRLEDAPRRLLETAAVLGREVSLRILRKMWNGRGSIESLLAELARHEFLTPKRSDEGRWIFKHPLIQECAYQRLQPSDRAELHGIAGLALETFYAGRLEEAYDRLAYHYSKSGERERAVEYLTRLAEKAARSNALAEAVRALEEAFDLANGLGRGSNGDGRAAELVLRRAQYLTLLNRQAEARDLLVREAPRFETSPLPSLRVRHHEALAAAREVIPGAERPSSTTRSSGRAEN